MYTIKFKIGEQWRAFPAKEYFWGFGTLKTISNSLYVEFENSEIRTAEVTQINIKVSDIKEGAHVFYILRKTDKGDDMIIFDPNFRGYNDIFIMQDGKTVDRL